MLLKGALVSVLSIILLYIILPYTYADPARWLTSNRFSDGTVQFGLRIIAVMIISIPIGVVIGWKQKANRLWIVSYAAGWLTTPVVVGLVLLIYVLLTIAP
ncbi:hypothetical protein PV433_16970 [Paenibacillus sp. GYB004]|uniref:hypothetical protein n=1 Tax=Paenibacillus sp. GYB004 TaxID=2994393 RepID=UPI002F963BCC